MNQPSPVFWHKRQGGVAVITLDNPPLNLNTLTSLARLLEVCEEVGADQEVRAVVLTGAGSRAFCAGSDVSEFEAVRHDVIARKLDLENRAFNAIEALPQPVVAALNGAAVGGGCEIALACDIRIADEHVTLGFPEVKLGVFAGSGGVFRLPRVVGLGAAYELLYTGDPIDTAQAMRIGLVNRITPRGQALQAAVELAETIAERSALAVTITKRLVRASHLQSVEQSVASSLPNSAVAFAGPDLDEGLAAFMDKRPPRFTAPRGTGGVS